MDGHGGTALVHLMRRVGCSRPTENEPPSLVSLASTDSPPASFAHSFRRLSGFVSLTPLWVSPAEGQDRQVTGEYGSGKYAQYVPVRIVRLRWAPRSGCPSSMRAMA